MQDREKVIKALECRKNADKRCGNPCEESGMCHYATAIRGLDGDIYKPFICDRERICADALAILKEQPEVVRCRECIRRGTYDCPIYVGGDEGKDSPDDWFCADGERGTDDA